MDERQNAFFFVFFFLSSAFSLRTEIEKELEQKMKIFLEKI